MTARLLTANSAVEQIKKDLKVRCQKLIAIGTQPTMSVVLVGENPASLSYIKNKKKICEEIGGRFNLLQLPITISAEDFLHEINKLNQDPNINGIIVQLPVSELLRSLNISELILPDKDIDGFHPDNTKKLYQGTTDFNLLLPCTPKGIITLLRHYGIEVNGKHVVVVGRSLIVGKPVSMLLTNLDATVTLAHSKTKELKSLTRKADIVIAAIGKANFLNADYFDQNSKTIVIDVGINSLDGKLCGDVDFNSVKNIVSAISPVPGGVGPMTVVSLVENLITATEKQMKGSL
jgi:methylenetetrahydrofolate dehydrogenase (NADP+)/methenyltetrahydrofolate cyclohydrolase